MSELVGPGSKYTDEDRRKAALEYSLTGSLTKVAARTGIPRKTLSDWKNKSDWWVEISAAVRHQKEAKILADNEEVIDKAHREIVDRLDNGDVQLVRTKNGVELHRVPVKAKDAAVIGGISDDKRRLTLNQPTAITGKSEDMAALANEFRKLSQQWDEKQVNVVAVQEESEENE
jgi:hypothetical protein